MKLLGFSTRIILRIAMWEFNYSDMPPSIIINEAIELAKCFAEHDAYKFINGVLDEWVKKNKPELFAEADKDNA
jgi:N utilization substance protein B